MSYQPYSLPRLPRKQCPHEVYYLRSGGGLRVDAEDCKHLAEKETGWCPEHRYVYELLQAADEAGYPQIDLGALRIGAGVADWEGYAQRHLDFRHPELMQKLKEAKARQDKANQKAIEKAIARSRRNAAYFEAGCA